MRERGEMGQPQLTVTCAKLFCARFRYCVVERERENGTPSSTN